MLPQKERAAKLSKERVGNIVDNLGYILVTSLLAIETVDKRITSN